MSRDGEGYLELLSDVEVDLGRRGDCFWPAIWSDSRILDWDLREVADGVCFYHLRWFLRRPWYV